jgi:hypothetical protein
MDMAGDLPFMLVMPAGGDIDKVREIGGLPFPLFPHKEIKKTKGGFIDVPSNGGTYSRMFVFNKDVEFLAVSVACTGYLFPDYWEVTIGEYKIYETVYTKEIPQTITSGTLGLMNYQVPAGTPIRVDFVNQSVTSKQVPFDLNVLVSAAEAVDLVITEA